MQIRVYEAYSKDVQFNDNLQPNFCQSAVMIGALVIIIFIYLSVLYFIGILVFITIRAPKILDESKEKDIELAELSENYKF